MIIVSYEVRVLLSACLKSLRPQIGADREVIVLDNNSDDGSAEMVKEDHPWVRLVPSATNMGFGRGCNVAARSALGRWILLLNPDTEVHPGSMDAMLDMARRHPEGAIFGGRTVDPEGRLDPRSCWGAPSLWSTACFAFGLARVFPRSRLFDPEAMGWYGRDTEREVGVVTGCLLLVGRDWWSRLGGFDERYFMYSEDTDLSLRARAEGGRVLVTPHATVSHVVGASSTRADKLVLVLTGKVTVARSHFGPVRGRLAVLMLMLGTFFRGRAWTVLTTKPSSAWTRAWERRREWIGGYRSTSAEPPSVPERNLCQ